MKTRLLIICIVIVIVYTSNANALLVGKTKDQLYNEHDVILIGNITKAEGQPFDRVTDYTVSVEKYLKSDLGPQLQLSASGKKGSNLLVEDETIYEVGDRVLLYLIKDDMSYQISPYSTVLDAAANAKCVDLYDQSCTATPNNIPYEFGANNSHPPVEPNIPLLIMIVVIIVMVTLILTLIIMIKRKH